MNARSKAYTVGMLAGNKTAKPVSDNVTNRAISHHKIISKDNKDKQLINENILTLFPEVEESAELRTALIISPNTLSEVSLKVSIEGMVNLPCNSKFVKVVENVIKILKIRESLDKIVSDCLIGSGGTLKIVLPQGVLDDFIYNLTPPDKKTTKLLASIDKHNEKVRDEEEKIVDIEYSLDSFKQVAVEELEDQIEIGDISNTISTAGIESLIEEHGDVLKTKQFGKLDITNIDIDLLNKLKKGKGDLSTIADKSYVDQADVVNLRLPGGLEGKLGQCLVKTVKSHAISVIHEPGNADNILGYLVGITKGHIVDAPKTETKRQQLSATDKLNSSIVIAARELERVTKQTTNHSEQRKLYGDFIMADVKDQLSTKLNKHTINVGNNPGLYDMLFSNAMKKLKTKLIFIPASNATYFTLRTRSNGMGKTRLESLTPLLGMRTTLLMSETYNKLIANAGILDVTAELDPRTPDVPKAVKDITDVITSANKMGAVSTITNMADAADLISNLGVRVHITGHSSLPSTTLQYEYIDPPRPEQDEDFRQSLANKTVKGMGVSPAMLEDGYESAFASESAATRDLIISSTTKDRIRINGFITDFVVKYIRHNSNILNTLTQAIKDDLPKIRKMLKVKSSISDDILIDTIIKSQLHTVAVELPSNVTGSSVLTDSFNSYKERVTVYVKEVLMPETVIAGMVEGIGEAINTDVDIEVELTPEGIQDLVISYYVRDWAVKHNYLPELKDIQINTPKLVKDISEVVIADSYTLIDFVVNIAKEVLGKASKDVDKTQPKEEEVSESTDSEEPPTDDTPPDDDGGEMDF